MRALRWPAPPPPAVGAIVDREVAGHDVEHDAHPSPVGHGAQVRQALRPAELLRDRLDVDGVVPMAAAGVGLEDGRQVEVGDAELRQEGHRLGHVGEGVAGVQLHAVRRGDRAHLGRRATGRGTDAGRDVHQRDGWRAVRQPSTGRGHAPSHPQRPTLHHHESRRYHSCMSPCRPTAPGSSAPDGQAGRANAAASALVRSQAGCRRTPRALWRPDSVTTCARSGRTGSQPVRELAGETPAARVRGTTAPDGRSSGSRSRGLDVVPLSRVGVPGWSSPRSYRVSRSTAWRPVGRTPLDCVR